MKLREDAVMQKDKIRVNRDLDKVETQSEINRMQLPKNRGKNLSLCREI